MCQRKQLFTSNITYSVSLTARFSVSVVKGEIGGHGMRALNNTTDVQLLKQTRQAVCQVFIIIIYCFIEPMVDIHQYVALPQSLANGRRIWWWANNYWFKHRPFKCSCSDGSWGVTVPSGFSFKGDIFSYLYPLKSFETPVSLEIHLVSHWLLPSADVILFVFGVNLRVWLTQGKEKSLIFF